MRKLVTAWRLREIRNMADSIAYRAAQSAIATLVVVAEKKHLKPTAHIRLFIDPKLNAGEAYHYIQICKNARYGDDLTSSKADLIEVTICFNGDLSSLEKRRKTNRAILKELGKVIFFSDAAKRKLAIRDSETENAIIKEFVDEIMKKHALIIESSRSRFTLAELDQIVKQNLHTQTRQVLRHMQKLLMPYIGPDGW